MKSEGGTYWAADARAFKTRDWGGVVIVGGEGEEFGGVGNVEFRDGVGRKSRGGGVAGIAGGRLGNAASLRTAECVRPLAIVAGDLVECLVELKKVGDAVEGEG